MPNSRSAAARRRSPGRLIGPDGNDSVGMQRKEPDIRASLGVVLTIVLAAARAAAAPLPTPKIDRSERLLVIAPHPDDETLGAGGLIQRVRANDGQVRVVLITAG